MSTVLLVATVGLLLVVPVLLAMIPFYATRGSVDGPLLHLTTPERLRCITADLPEGWVHLRPGVGWKQRLPLLGWPPRPFTRRIYFYVGAEWPGPFRCRYNLPHPEQCTNAVVIEVEDLRTYGSGGSLYRRRIDGAAAWSGEYRGPGRVISSASSGTGEQR